MPQMLETGKDDGLPLGHAHVNDGKSGLRVPYATESGLRKLVELLIKQDEKYMKILVNPLHYDLLMSLLAKQAPSVIPIKIA